MAVHATTGSQARDEAAVGVAAALAAFLIWGFAPLYFKLIEALGPWEIIAHRILWTAVLLGLLLAAMGRLGGVRDAVSSPRRFLLYATTTVLVTLNWSIFIWAVLDDRLLDASLGYFINPLVNVLLGVLFLHERLSRGQLVAVVLATIGVAASVVAAGKLPWIALVLAFSFGFYALLRKRGGIDPMIGLFVETALVAPLTLIYLAWLGIAGVGAFGPPSIGGEGWGMSLVLVAAGVITGAPLVLVMVGAQRLTLATIGVMQYIGPSLNFLLAVLVFGEPFTSTSFVTFAFIWSGLAVFTWDALRRHRGSRRADALDVEPP